MFVLRDSPPTDIGTWKTLVPCFSLDSNVRLSCCLEAWLDMVPTCQQCGGGRSDSTVGPSPQPGRVTRASRGINFLAEG